MLWRIGACLIGFEMSYSDDGRGRRRAEGRSALCFSRRLTFNEDTLSFGRRGGINLGGVNLLRSVGSFTFIVSIAFGFVIDVDLISLVLFLIVFVVNGDTIRN